MYIQIVAYDCINMALKYKRNYIRLAFKTWKKGIANRKGEIFKICLTKHMTSF